MNPPFICYPMLFGVVLLFDDGYWYLAEANNHVNQDDDEVKTYHLSRAEWELYPFLPRDLRQLTHWSSRRKVKRAPAHQMHGSIQ